jgi:hypothetical protein
VKVVVTQEHIDTGVCKDIGNCALALAVNEQLLPGMWAEVSADDVEVYTKVSKDFVLGCEDDDGDGYCLDCFEEEVILLGCFPLPARATAFVKAFDSVEPVRPFSFEL